MTVTNAAAECLKRLRTSKLGWKARDDKDRQLERERTRVLRAQLAERQGHIAAANDNGAARPHGTRIGRNLKKHDPELYAILVDAERLLYPANDNRETTPAESGLDDLAVQCSQDIRPTEAELLQAVGWWAWPFTGTRGPWRMRRRPNLAPVVNGHIVTLGDLVFTLDPKRREEAKPTSSRHELGLLLEFGRTAANKPRRPGIDFKQQSGRVAPTAPPADVRGYLALSGEPGILEGHVCTPKGVNTAPARTGRAIEADALLAAAWANTDITKVRCWGFSSPAPAKGYEPPTVGTTARSGIGERGGEVDDVVNGCLFRDAIGDDAVEVLEDVFADEDYGAVGRRLGHAGDYARKAGRRAVISTLKKIRETVSVFHGAVPVVVRGSEACAA